MVERTEGPFHYYQDIHPGVNGDTIRADSYDPGLHTETLDALKYDLEGDARKVPRLISGDITSAVALPAWMCVGEVRTLAANGRYAVGLMGSFAGCVDLFDITVNTLNKRFNTNLATAMHPVPSETGGKPERATRAEAAPGVRAAIQPDYDAAMRILDDGADRVALKFKQGATPENVRALMRVGLVPLSAASLYPGLTLTDADRRSYYAALQFLPSAPDPDSPPDEDEGGGHWYDGLVSAGKWTYNHTVVPTVNGLANLGQAMFEHPEDLLSMAAGAGLIILGTAGEGGGLLLDATGVGAIGGVPLNVASAAVITAGATLTGAGAVDLAHHASQNNNTVLNEAQGSGGSGSSSGPRPGDPLPESSRPSAAGKHWEGRVADNGKGQVWQDPESRTSVKGQSKNRNVFRDEDPSPDYPHGCVRFYNSEGQPLRLDGKPGNQADTHIAKNPDGSYPIPKGWNP